MPGYLRKAFGVFMCLALLLVSIPAASAASAAERKVIGIADFQTGSAVDASLSSFITNTLTENIITNRSFRLVDRHILSQRLAAAGLSTNAYERCADLAPEQLAGIHFLVTGAIQETGVELIRQNGFQQLRSRLVLNVRVLHVPAMQIVYAESVIGEAQQTFLLEQQEAAIDNAATRKALLEQAAKKVLARIAAKIHSLNPMTGTLLQVNPADKTVVLDLGSEHGVAVGQLYRLYTEGSVLVHPVTNLEIGRESKEIAVVQIIAVNALDSSAKLVNGRLNDIQPGLNAIRLPTSQ